MDRRDFGLSRCQYMIGDAFEELTACNSGDGLIGVVWMNTVHLISPVLDAAHQTYQRD